MISYVSPFLFVYYFESSFDAGFLKSILKPNITINFTVLGKMTMGVNVKPHHPNFVWVALLSSGSVISARPDDRLPYLIVRPMPEFWQLTLLVHFLG